MDELTFQDELRLAPINVPRAALRFARAIAYPDLDIAQYMMRLDRLATSARDVIPATGSAVAQAEALVGFLFRQLAFAGNEDEYDDPRNSFLNEVLDRGLGIPISLSTLYIAVAERLGLPAYGVGLPGHFIVGVRDATGSLYFDPFHGGARLTLADCLRLVQDTTGYDGPFHMDWLDPASPLDILARMLNNLRAVYVNRQAWPQAILVVEHLRAVQPDDAEHLRDLGYLHYQNGSLRLASRLLEEYLWRASNAPDAASVRQALGIILGQFVRLN